MCESIKQIPAKSCKSKNPQILLVFVSQPTAFDVLTDSIILHMSSIDFKALFCEKRLQEENQPETKQ